jgi:hypothetical protein
MKITKVQYGKTYSLGNYCSERIDLEATLDERDLECDVIGFLKDKCDEIHKKNNPHLYQEEPIIKTTQPIEQTVTPKDDRIGRYLAIQAATTLEELEAVKIQPEDKLDIPYNTQKKKLQAK